MSYTFNNNQPFVFNYDNGFCGTNQREYCLLKEPSDKLNMQFKVNPNTTNLVLDSTMSIGSQLMTNPYFDTGGGGWTYTGNFIQGITNANKAAGASGTVYQAVTGIAAGKCYFVKIHVATSITGSITFSIGGVTASTNLGAATGSVYATGYFQAVNTNPVTFSADSPYAGVVWECHVYEVDFMVGAGTDFTDFNDTGFLYSWENATSLCHTQGNTTNVFPLLSGYTFNLTLNKTYKIVLSVTNMTEGSLSVLFGGTTAGTITANGSYYFTATATTGFLGLILSLAPSSNFNGCIDDLYLYSYDTGLNLAIFDLEDNWVMDIPSDYVAQSGEWFYVEATPTQLGLSEGCYRICLTDNVASDPVQQEIVNGGFTLKDEGWTYNNPAGSTEWTFPANEAVGKVYSINDTLTIGQKITGDSCWIGQQLTCTFDINVLSGNGEFTFGAYGFNTSTIYVTEVYTGGQTGTKTVTFTVTDDTEVVIGFSFTALSIEEPGAYEEVQFTNVSVMDLGCDLTYPYCSNCFSVKAEHECTKKIEWYNTKNSFGFNYANVLVNPTWELRILMEFGKWKHKQNWDIWKNYNLNSSVVAADSTEVFEVRTEMLPENIHRCLAIARQHEYLYIDSVRTYAVDDDYEPEWSEKNKNFAIVRFDVWQQALRSNSCGIDVTSQDDLNYLIDPQDENCVISLE